MQGGQPRRDTPSASSPRRAPAFFFLCFLSLVLAFSLRVYNLDWDKGNLLHPDERAILMVTSQIHWPGTSHGTTPPGGPGTNPLNPHFFAYGSLPFYLLASTAHLAHKVGQFLAGTPLAHSHLQTALIAANVLPGMALWGRFLSVLFDTGSVVLIGIIGALLAGRWTGLLASTLYGVTALAVQQAHYFVVDPILVFWILLTLLFCLQAVHFHSLCWLLAAAMTTGAALATKVSALPLGLPLLLTAISLSRCASSGLALSLHVRLLNFTKLLLIILVLVISTCFICQPFAFLDSRQFLTDIIVQSGMARGTLDFPYTRQYAPTPPYWYFFQGLLLWEMTPLPTLIGSIGLLWQLWQIIHTRISTALIIAGWWLPYWLITGSFYAKYPRYMLPLAPFLCLGAALLLVTLFQKTQPKTVARYLLITLIALTVLTPTLYCFAYEHIYATTNTQVAASEWIYTHIPSTTDGHRTTLTHEVWDDFLPLDLTNINPNWYPGIYRIIDVPAYDPDTATKRQTLIRDVESADYIIEASEIVRGSILRNPQRYPMMVAFYQALSDGALGFAKVVGFRSVPQLFGLKINDESSDLNWQYYDHPPVTIYHKIRQLSPTQVQALLPLPPQAALLSPKTSTLPPASRNTLLRTQRFNLSSPIQQAVPTYDAMFPPNGIAIHLAPIIWLALIEFLALLVFPIAARFTRATPELTWAVAKPLSLLILGWGSWIVASLSPLGNRHTTMLLVLAIFVVGSVLLFGISRSQLSGWKHYRKLWITSEVVFLTVFTLFLIFRALDPDLWQLYLGGEKPMELSYINAILRSRTLPPYDPWLSGDTMNYYYFGFYLMALLFRLTEIPPTIGLNLAIPLLAGAASQVVFAVGALFTALLCQKQSVPFQQATGKRRWWAWRPFSTPLLLTRPPAFSKDFQADPTRQDLVLAGGALSALAFFLLGNLSVVPWFLTQLSQIGRAATTVPLPLQPIAHIVDGLRIAISTGFHVLPAFDFFDTTRVIPYTINEFPFFTFLYADVHPHVIDLPFEATAIAFTVAIVMGSRRIRQVPLGLTEVLLGSLLLGALFPINTWDYPTYLILIGLGWILRYWDPRMPAYAAGRGLIASVITIIIGHVLFLPFYAHFSTADAGLAIVHQHSPPLAWFEVFGILVFPTVSFLLVFQGTTHSHQLLVAAVVALIVALVLRSPVCGFLSGILILIMLTTWLRRWWSSELLILLILFVAFAVLFGIELVYIPDPLRYTDYYRMNTVFKFGEQVWLLLATVFGATTLWLLNRTPWPLYHLTHQSHPITLASSTAQIPIERLSPRHNIESPGKNQHIPHGMPLWWLICGGLLLATSLAYPVLATPVRLDNRWPHNPPGPSLNGFAFADINYPADYTAIRWLQRHITGTPVVLEATHGDYTWAGRISWFTGFADLLGWSYHTSQFHPSSQVGARQQVVQTLYTTPSATLALQLLLSYHVNLIYIGPLEHQLYGTSPHAAASFAKWRTLLAKGDLTLLYNREGVQIYQVREQSLP